MKTTMEEIYGRRRWVLPCCLALLLGVAVSFTFAAGNTWAWGSSGIDHMLTYTENQLTWGSNTGIRADGSAELTLFRNNYENAVVSQNTDKLVAPGTLGGNTIRLENATISKVSYTTVLYRIQSNEAIPLKAVLKAEGALPTSSYTLPVGVTDAQVVDAVGGVLNGKQYLDFDVEWNWIYDESDTGDRLDTALGDMAAAGEADTVTLGIYTVVTDEESQNRHKTVVPTVPKTGDRATMTAWIIAACLSLAMLLLLLWNEYEERRHPWNKG